VIQSGLYCVSHDIGTIGGTQYKLDCITTIQVVHSTNWTVSCLYHVIHSTNLTVSRLYRWYTVQTRHHLYSRNTVRFVLCTTWYRQDAVQFVLSYVPSRNTVRFVTNWTVLRLYRWYTVRTGLYYDYTGGTQYKPDCITTIQVVHSTRHDTVQFVLCTTCIVVIQSGLYCVSHDIGTIQSSSYCVPPYDSTNWTASCLYHVVHSTNRTVLRLYRWYIVRTGLYYDYTGGTQYEPDCIYSPVRTVYHLYSRNTVRFVLCTTCIVVIQSGSYYVPPV
jgi:hypothetical protein